jgi:hypothetical protein
MMCQYWVISIIVLEALESTPFNIIHSLFSIGIWSRIISQADDWENTHRIQHNDSSQW